MEYSEQENNIIFKMKTTIVNEFKYRHATGVDISFLACFSDLDMEIGIDSLCEACRVGIDYQLIDNLRKKQLQDLVGEALVELFSEDIIRFPSNESVALTSKGEKMFIEDNMLYSVVGKK